jgi:hypothetical protein
MMKRILLIYSILFITFTQNCFAQNQRPEFLEKALAYLYISNPAQTLSKIDELFQVMGQSTLNGQGFVSTVFLKNSKIESFDLSKEMIYARIHPKICPNPFLYIAHLKDKELFISGFGKSIFGGKGFTLDETTRNEPIQQFIEEKVQFDREGYLQAQEKGPVDIVQYQKRVTTGYFVAFVDTRVIVSGNRELVAELMTQSPTKLELKNHPDLEIVFKPLLIREAYHQDLESMSQKLTPFLISNLKTFQFLLKLLISHLGPLSEIQFHLTLKDNLLKLNINLKSNESSRLSKFLSNPVPTKKLLSELPSNELEGFLRFGGVISDELEPLRSSNQPTEALIQNYLHQTEGILNLYFLPSPKAVKALMSIPIKKDHVEQADLDFKKIMQEEYHGQISNDSTDKIQTVQFSKRKMYITFIENDQWIGLGLGLASSEDFKNSISKINTQKLPSDEVLKMTAEFPEKINLIFYLKPEPQIFISGYGEIQGTDLHLFFHLNVKEWVKTYGPKIREKRQKKQPTLSS